MRDSAEDNADLQFLYESSTATESAIRDNAVTLADQNAWNAETVAQIVRRASQVITDVAWWTAEATARVEAEPQRSPSGWSAGERSPMMNHRRNDWRAKVM